MSLKRRPTDAEIVILAKQLRPLWQQGDSVRPWLRQHHEVLLGLVHGEWSWAAVSAALTKAGITYRTGKPWTEKQLRSEMSRSLQPLKGYRRRKPKPELPVAAAFEAIAVAAGPPAAGLQMSAVPIPPLVRFAASPPSPSPTATVSAARFKPASFRLQEPPSASSISSEATAQELTPSDHPAFGSPDPKEPS